MKLCSKVNFRPFSILVFLIIFLLFAIFSHYSKLREKQLDAVSPSTSCAFVRKQILNLPFEVQSVQANTTEQNTAKQINQTNQSNQTVTYERLLRIALLPVGSTMYVWGGGWNEADTGSGIEAVTIGVSPNWADFASLQDSSYDFNTTRYQIHNGLDCSGYLGWLIYNVLHSENGKEEDGYVSSASAMAQTLASDYQLGTFIPADSVETYQPGDIISMPGHVWMSLGSMPDKSVLLVHSSPPGVRICGTYLPNGADSEAVILARSIMATHYPAWYRRYPECGVNADYLTASSMMRWDELILPDEEGLRHMTAKEVMDYLFQND